MMPIDKKQWFDVPDSLTKREDGKGEYCNVEARFSDHPVINLQKSQIARHNVYDFSIVLHTRVKRAAGDVPAQKNMTAQPIRFDKGTALPRGEFDTLKALLMRCWDAWEHYQQFREAPVTDAERVALEQIAAAPLSALGTVMVDRGDGVLVPRTLAGNEDEDGEDEDEVVHAPPPPAKKTAPRKKKAA